jgi:hypothetical protein
MPAGRLKRGFGSPRRTSAWKANRTSAVRRNASGVLISDPRLSSLSPSATRRNRNAIAATLTAPPRIEMPAMEYR